MSLTRHNVWTRVRRRTWLALAAASGVTAVAFAACQTPTSMTVSVSTDVDCGALVQERRAHIVVGTPESVIGELEASSTKGCEGEGEIGEVVFLPRDDEGAEVAFKVILGVDVATETCGTGDGSEEEKWAGCIVARRRLRFIEGEALKIDVPLHEECIGIPCSEAAFETCIAGGRCVPADVDPDDCLEGGCNEDDLSAAATGVGSSAATGDGGAAPTSSASTGGDGGRGGGGPGCVDPAHDCDEVVDDCMIAFCDDGACSIRPAERLDPCETGVCDGEGLCVECFDESQCEQEACRTGACEGGLCVYTDLEDTTVCDQDCDDGTATTSYCDGEGFCGPPTNDVACYPFLCEGPVCGAMCGDEDDCIEGAECDTDECVIECDDVGDCPAPESVCQVAACPLGHCEAVAGHEGDPCSAPRCSDDGGSVESAGVCDQGQCSITSTPCGDYACVAGACMEDCIDTDDCFGGATCTLGECGFGGSTTGASSTIASVSASSASTAASSTIASVSVSASASTAETTVASSTASSIASSGVGPTTGAATVSNASNASVADGGFAWSDGGAPPW